MARGLSRLLPSGSSARSRTSAGTSSAVARRRTTSAADGHGQRRPHARRDRPVSGRHPVGERQDVPPGVPAGVGPLVVRAVEERVRRPVVDDGVDVGASRPHRVGQLRAGRPPAWPRRHRRSASPSAGAPAGGVPDHRRLAVEAGAPGEVQVAARTAARNGCRRSRSPRSPPAGRRRCARAGTRSPRRCRRRCPRAWPRTCGRHSKSAPRMPGPRRRPRCGRSSRSPRRPSPASANRSASAT